MAILNSRNSATVVSLSDLIHIVDVDDPTDNPLGTSKKASIQQIRDLISSYTDTFVELTDTPGSYSGQGGKGVRVNAGGTALEFYDIVVGASDYVSLTDTPAAFTGDNNKFVRVNAGATALEHVAGSSINISEFNNDAGFITSNITHTGEVTGLASLSLDPTAISNKTLVTPVATDMLLLWDATDSALKRVDAADFLAGGADGNGIFDAANDNGVIPTLFNAQLTNSFTFTDDEASPRDVFKVNDTGEIVSTINAAGVVDSFKTINNLGNDIFQITQTSGDEGQLLLGSSTGTTLVSLNGTLDYFNTGNRFGIGTNNPIADLHLTASAHNNGFELFQTNGTTRAAILRHVINATSMASSFVMYEDNGTTAGIQLGGASTTYSFINDGNNFGIGTTTPSAKLHVGGNAQIDGDLNVDNNVLFVQSSTDSVGINTNTPQKKLHIVSNADANMRFENLTGSDIWDIDAGVDLDITNNQTNGTAYALNSQSGLDVTLGGTNNVLSTLTGSNTSAIDLRLNNTTISGYWALRATGSGYASSVGAMIIDSPNLTRVLTLANNGNVGIGINTPSEKLDVSGNANVSGVYKVGGVSGFTGTGAYTNFTIVGGIITAAS